MRKLFYLMLVFVLLFSCEDDQLVQDQMVPVGNDYKVGISDKSLARNEIANHLTSNPVIGAMNAHSFEENIQSYEELLDFERAYESTSSDTIRQYIPIKTHSHETRNLVIQNIGGLSQSFIANYSKDADDNNLIRITNLAGEELGRVKYNNLGIIETSSELGMHCTLIFEIICNNPPPTMVSANSGDMNANISQCENVSEIVVGIECVEDDPNEPGTGGGGGSGGGGGGGSPPPDDTPPPGDDTELPPDLPETPELPPSDDPSICIGGWDCDDGPIFNPICETDYDNFGCCRFPSFPQIECTIDESFYSCIEENLWDRLEDDQKDYLRENDPVVEIIGQFYSDNIPLLIASGCQMTNDDLNDAAEDYLDCRMSNGTHTDCQSILDNADCNLSPSEFDALFPNATDETRDTFIEYVNKYGRDFGINTPDEMHHFLSQVGVECEYFTVFVEDLNYSASRLVVVWPDHFTLDTITQPTKRWAYNYDNDSEALANFIYSTDAVFAGDGRACMNGNEASGDGYKYRGRGIKQLTNKCNYTDFHNFLYEWVDNGIGPITHDIIGDPDLLAEETNIDSLSVISALWFYEEKVLINRDLPNNASVRSVTRSVNGGLHGLSNRQDLYEEAQTDINCYN